MTVPTSLAIVAVCLSTLSLSLTCSCSTIIWRRLSDARMDRRRHLSAATRIEMATVWRDAVVYQSGKYEAVLNDIASKGVLVTRPKEPSPFNAVIWGCLADIIAAAKSGKKVGK
jgi:hypothetical protein